MPDIDRVALREQYMRSGIMFDVRPLDLLDGWDQAEAKLEAANLNLTKALEEREQLRIENNKARALLQRVKADRPSAHSDEIWADINAFINNQGAP
jgi:regulator of replication initiation timing